MTRSPTPESLPRLKSPKYILNKINIKLSKKKDSKLKHRSSLTKVESMIELTQPKV